MRDHNKNSTDSFINNLSAGENMFKKTVSVSLDSEIVEKAKRQCKQHGMSVEHFIEEAVIEKIIKSDIKE